jgi:hypothetical protein
MGICEVPAGCHAGHLKGEEHAMAKLTDDQVRAIRKSTASNQVLAEKYRLHVSTIWLVRSNRRWRHLDD